MPSWRIVLIAAGCAALLLGSSSARADTGSLPDPDYESVKRVAQRVHPKISYYMSLPQRKWLCLQMAEPYFDRGTTKTMADGLFIMRECYSAMILRMAELYYKSDAFGPGGMPVLLDKFRKDLGRLYGGLYREQITCGYACGSMGYVLGIAKSEAVIEQVARDMVQQQMHHDELKQWRREWEAADWGH